MRNILVPSHIFKFRVRQRSRYILTCILLVIVALATCVVFSQQSATHAADATGFFSSIDTMKVSRDTETHPLADAEIGQIVGVASKLHSQYIAVDTLWDYPDYMAQWINAIRATNHHVWFRGHPNQWENNNHTPGIMTPQAYEEVEKQFILAHPTFFQPGDIFDACSEPEEGHYWRATYNTGWTSHAPNTATRDYNAFLRDTTDVADAALHQSGISGVITTIRSTNSFFATHPDVLEAATVQKFGYVTVDSYPEQGTTDPVEATRLRVDELNAVYNTWRVPIIIGELGYSNRMNVDDATQQAVLKAELVGISQLPFIVGANYWTGPGSNTAGGYTYIIGKANGAWTMRPAASEVAAYFQNKPVPVVIATPGSVPTPTAIPTSTTTSGYQPTIYEAESSANTLTGVAQAKSCETCSGGMEVVKVGKIATAQGAVNSMLIFNVTVPRPGNYTVVIYYTNGDPVRTAYLSVNNQPGNGISFPQPGSRGDWSTVGSLSVTVNLPQGHDTLTLFNPFAAAPNFDRIVV